MITINNIGPFFYINGEYIAHCIPDWRGEKRGGKLDNPYSHESLYDDFFHDGDYIDVPRGRVVWDTEADRAILYLDRCIEKINGAVEKIAKRFDGLCGRARRALRLPKLHGRHLGGIAYAH